MLLELRIRGYAVIDDLALELNPGLNVLSGETGAGKSIIVGALSLLVGERASSQVVRSGADRAVVEAVFDLGGREDLGAWLEERGFPSEDAILILRREVASEGRNRAWINGSPATATAVGELGARLVDIHGQHEHQSLLKPAHQRVILDEFGGGEGLAREVRTLHQELSRSRAELERKKARLRELDARADFLRFQLREIEEARLEVGEEDGLDEEARRLAHAEELASGTGQLHQALYGGDDALSDRVSALREVLDRLAGLDPSLASLSTHIQEAYHLLSEAGQTLGSYASGVEHDPPRLEEIRQRQDLLFRLKRKYGPKVSDVLETGRRLKEEVSELESASFDVAGMERELVAIQERFLGRVKDLSRLREEAARRLEEEVRALLPDLGMTHGRFDVRLQPQDEPESGGGERVELLVSLNPGFEVGPLSRIASGGELSRVMLALKAILARADKVPTLVFDEIDAGIGGQVAQSVAGKLREVAEHHQVFVITHLPQLASRAHHQLSVEKAEEGGLAVTRVRKLMGEERVWEVARMLGGDPESPTSQDHARELLDLS
ncbi:DNA repair protein RecN [Gemmatimonadota bacterium]